jgi:PAS domain S-box-containing protein
MENGAKVKHHPSQGIDVVTKFPPSKTSFNSTLPTARGGLRRRWLKALLWLLLPFLLFVWVSAWGFSSFWRRATEHNLRALVHFQTAQVQTFLLEQQRFQQTLLSSLSARKASIVTTPGPTSRPQLSSSLKAWLTFHKQQGKLSALGLQDAQGRWLGVVGNSLKQVPPKPGTTASKRQILHFSSAQETLMRTAFPLRSTSGKPLWLWVDAYFRIHQRFLQERKAPAFRGMILLLDSRHRLLCGSLDIDDKHHKHHKTSHHHHFGKKVALPSLLHSSNPPSNLWGRVHLYLNGKGQKTLGIGLRLPKTNWKVWVELPESLAFKELREWQWQTLLAALVVLLLLVFVVLWKTRQMSQPLEQLLQATETLRQRDFSALPLSAQQPAEDELEALTLAFSEMGMELRYLYEHLESEVERRTLALNEARNFSELLFESIPDAILVTDRELKVVKANRSAQELFGEQLNGRCCYHLLDGQDAVQEDCAAHQVLLTGKPISREDTQPHPVLGEWFYRDCFPIQDEEGKVIGVLESIKRITRQKQLAAQAMHREKMAALGLLASGVAHEIGNPLASISAVLQRLHRRAPDDDAKETFSELLERTDRISRILSTLSGYARKKSDRKTPLHVNREVEKAVELVQFDKRARQATLALELGPNLPLTWAPEDALSQIVTNLLINAMDATEGLASPEIQIRTWASSDGIRLRVQDNGPGIPRELRERVFEPFFTTKPESRGTGLGLSICLTLAESMQGQLELLEVEQGTALELWLPATLDEMEPKGEQR